MRVILIILVVLLPACSQPEAPIAQTTTYLISGPETPKKPISVREFEVIPEVARLGQQVTARTVLQAEDKGRKVSVNWYGPDGWLIGYHVFDTAQPQTSTKAPFDSFDENGRYRAVLRSGGKVLAEEEFTIAAR